MKIYTLFTCLKIGEHYTNSNGNEHRNGTIDDGPHIHEFGNKAAGGNYHLHSFYQEAVAVHGEADGNDICCHSFNALVELN